MVLSANTNKFRFRKMILLLIIAGTAVLLISSVSAETGVTISAQGDQSYYLGEEIVLSGSNYNSDFTYLFITGPGISPNGGKLISPLKDVVSGDPGSFESVQTKPDKTWEYTLYTYSLGINPGPYAIYAASQPKTAAQLTGVDNKSVRVIFKKPFITAGITPSTILKGQPFMVTGFAEGNPDAVQGWIIGDNYFFATIGPTNPDSSFTFNITPQISEKIPEGQYYLILQHPMQNNQLDIVPSGDWVKNLQLNGGSPGGGMNLFRSTGAGSLQGHDAAEALIAALNDPTVDDTYTEIPLVVDATGMKNGAMSEVSVSGPSTIQAQAASTAPVQHQTPASPLQYAPLGAIVLIAGIVALSRR
jgi:hypothetical protein